MLVFHAGRGGLFHLNVVTDRRVDLDFPDDPFDLLDGHPARRSSLGGSQTIDMTVDSTPTSL